MANKKYVYQYWHRIDRVGPAYKGKVKVGNAISHSFKREGRWETVNLKTGRFSWSCECTYLGRTRTDMPKEEKIRKLEEWLKSKNGERE